MRQVYIEAEKNFFPFGFFPTAAKIVLQLGNKKEICSHERLFLSLSPFSAETQACLPRTYFQKGIFSCFAHQLNTCFRVLAIYRGRDHQHESANFTLSKLNLENKNQVLVFAQLLGFKVCPFQGCGGGGLVVSVLAFYSNDPSSNPAGYLNFLNEKTKINEREAEVGPSLKKKFDRFKLQHLKFNLMIFFS